MRQCIQSADAPPAVGPYSQAIAAGPFVFCSGQIPLKPDGNSWGDADVATQTRQVLTNLGAVLNAAGLSLSDVVKTTVFLTNLQDFAAMNEVYASFFSEPFPARSTIQVSALPRGAQVEIEAVAFQSQKP
jgi:2-iminobutanoate/2-iminopropanoate deaminase